MQNFKEKIFDVLKRDDCADTLAEELRTLFKRASGEGVVGFIPLGTQGLRVYLAEKYLSWVGFFLTRDPGEPWKVATADENHWYSDPPRFQKTVGWSLKELLEYAFDNLKVVNTKETFTTAPKECYVIDLGGLEK